MGVLPIVQAGSHCCPCRDDLHQRKQASLEAGTPVWKVDYAADEIGASSISFGLGIEDNNKTWAGGFTSFYFQTVGSLVFVF